MSLTTLFLTMSIQYGLPNGLLSSLCYIESKHQVNAIHYNDGKTHSFGVCQIKYETAKTFGFKGTEQQLMEPYYNVKYAAKYLQHQIKRYDGNISRAVVAYNRGNAKGLTSSQYQVKVFDKWLTAKLE